MNKQYLEDLTMVRYSLTSEEHEIKRALRRVQREIKQGIFVEIPLDYEDLFARQFFVKLANTKSVDDSTMEINGNEVEIKNVELDRHEYDEDNIIYFLSNEQLKEVLEKYSYTLAEDLRLISLAILPQSVREMSKDDYIHNQFKFVD